jgi:hypothetical protein
MPFDGKDSQSIAAAIEAGKYCLDPEVGWFCRRGGAARRGSAGCLPLLAAGQQGLAARRGSQPGKAAGLAQTSRCPPETLLVQHVFKPTGHPAVTVLLTRAPALWPLILPVPAAVGRGV